MQQQRNAFYKISSLTMPPDKALEHWDSTDQPKQYLKCCLAETEFKNHKGAQVMPSKHE
jgi:hypothetical protein